MTRLLLIFFLAFSYVPRAVSSVGTAIGPLMFALCFDEFSSYDSILIATLPFALVAFSLMQHLRFSPISRRLYRHKDTFLC